MVAAVSEAKVDGKLECYWTSSRCVGSEKAVRCDWSKQR